MQAECNVFSMQTTTKQIKLNAGRKMIRKQTRQLKSESTTAPKMQPHKPFVLADTHVHIFYYEPGETSNKLRG